MTSPTVSQIIWSWHPGPLAAPRAPWRSFLCEESFARHWQSLVPGARSANVIILWVVCCMLHVGTPPSRDSSIYILCGISFVEDIILQCTFALHTFYHHHHHHHISKASRLAFLHIPFFYSHCYLRSPWRIPCLLGSLPALAFNLYTLFLLHRARSSISVLHALTHVHITHRLPRLTRRYTLKFPFWNGVLIACLSSGVSNLL